MVFFKINTESNVDLADSTIGIIIDDVSVGSGTYDAACSSYRHGSSNRGYTYTWDAGNGAWELETSGSDWDDHILVNNCLLYTSPSPRDRQKSRMPSSA